MVELAVSVVVEAGRRDVVAGGLVGVAAVEVAVAAAGGAFKGGGVGGEGGGRGHELAAAVEGVPADGGGVVLEAFAVGDNYGQRRRRRRLLVAVEGAVNGEG